MNAGLKVGGRADRTLIVAAEEYPVPPNFDQRPGLVVSAPTARTLHAGDGRVMDSRSLVVPTPRTRVSQTERLRAR